MVLVCPVRKTDGWTVAWYGKKLRLKFCLVHWSDEKLRLKFCLVHGSDEKLRFNSFPAVPKDCGFLVFASKKPVNKRLLAVPL